MEMNNVILHIFCIVLVDAFAVGRNSEGLNTTIEFGNDPDNVFNNVYSECFFHLSYTCLQKKTLLYLKELNNLSEVSVIGDFVKFVKINITSKTEDINKAEYNTTNNSDELTFMIDKAVDNFFNNHVLKFSALGRDISMSKNVEEFVGRKKRKGGGGGGGGDHGDHDGGKKKMMMMAMMCMKMKLMMMVPAMMGMMGMMSFKGMMFSMMSFMISKMMLLMKLLEKKGGGSGFGGAAGGGDGVWAASGGGGGAWMPAGSQDYGGGGYDSNAQWQSRSIFELDDRNKPIISYVTPIVSHNNLYNKKNIGTIRTLNGVINNKINDTPKSRKKRDIIDILQNSYVYWINRLFGVSYKRRTNTNIPKFKTVNGVNYVFYPFRKIQKVKMIKDVQGNKIKSTEEGFKPIILTADDFNKGEIFEGAAESRMSKKKFHKMKDAVNDTVDDNPWE